MVKSYVNEYEDEDDDEVAGARPKGYDEENDEEDDEEKRVTKKRKPALAARAQKKRLADENTQKDNEVDDDDENEGKNGKASGPVRKVQRRAASSKDNDDDYEEADGDGDVDDDDDDDDDDDGDVNVQGKDADFEAGQIISIKATDFMCHAKLSMDFGKHVFFITGDNGSGKSAIVAALQLCLGARADNTGRGKNLAGFIREGTDGPAIVQVRLRNEGSDAFKPDLYGRHITIERRIPKNGAAKYRLISENGTIVSSESRELRALQRQFNVYMENPCCVLTQEESKKFIQGHERDKYAFFLKATGLDQTRTELKEAKANLELTEKDVVNGEMRAKAKHDAVNELKGELRALLALDSGVLEIGKLLSKGYWAEHATKVEVVNRLEETLEEKRQALVEAEVVLAECKGAQGSEDIDELERAVNELGERKSSAEADCEEKRRACNAKVGEVGEIKRVERVTQGLINEQRSRLEHAQRDLKAAHQRMRENSEGDARALMEQIDNIQRDIAARMQEETAARSERELLRAALKEADSACKKERPNMYSIKGDLERAQNDLRNVSNNDANAVTRRLGMIGNELPRVVAEIEKTRFRERPVGPIGMHVKVKDGHGRRWGKAVEKILGWMLKAFVVTNTEDQYTLKGILMRLNCAHFIKIVYQERRARYDIPRLDGALTVNDVIAVDNDSVFNCLIDQSNPDTVIMCKDEDELITYRGARGFNNPKIKKAVMENGDEFQYNQFGNTKNNKNRTIFRNVLAEDMREQQAQLQEAVAAMQRDLSDAQEALNALDAQRETAEKEVKRADARVDTLVATIRNLNRMLSDKKDELGNAQEAGKVDTTEIEGTIATAEEKLRLANEELQRTAEDIAGLNSEFKELKAAQIEADNVLIQVDKELQEAERRVMNFEQGANRRKQKLNAANVKVMAAKNTMDKAQEHLDVQRQNMAVAYDEAFAFTKTAYVGWDEKPMALGPNDTKKTLDKEANRLKADLERSRNEANLAGRTVNSVSGTQHFMQLCAAAPS